MGAGVVCVFVILRSDSEEVAATAWRPAGKGHSDSVVPPAVAEFFGMIRLPRLAVCGQSLFNFLLLMNIGKERLKQDGQGF